MAGKYKILELSKGNLTKEQQQAKLHAEMMATDGLTKLQTTPPRHLDPVAANEYRRIIASLGSLPLRNLDRAELEAYCTWYSVYKRTTIDMSDALAAGNSEEYYGYTGVLNKATMAIKGLASDLGLNVNSRMAMNMPKSDEDKPKSMMDEFG